MKVQHQSNIDESIQLFKQTLSQLQVTLTQSQNSVSLYGLKIDTKDNLKSLKNVQNYKMHQSGETIQMVVQLKEIKEQIERCDGSKYNEFSIENSNVLTLLESPMYIQIIKNLTLKKNNNKQETGDSPQGGQIYSKLAKTARVQQIIGSSKQLETKHSFTCNLDDLIEQSNPSNSCSSMSEYFDYNTERSLKIMNKEQSNGLSGMSLNNQVIYGQNIKLGNKNLVPSMLLTKSGNLQSNSGANLQRTNQISESSPQYREVYSSCISSSISLQSSENGDLIYLPQVHQKKTKRTKYSDDQLTKVEEVESLQSEEEQHLYLQDSTTKSSYLICDSSIMKKDAISYSFLLRPQDDEKINTEFSRHHPQLQSSL